MVTPKFGINDIYIFLKLVGIVLVSVFAVFLVYNNICDNSDDIVLLQTVDATRLETEMIQNNKIIDNSNDIRDMKKDIGYIAITVGEIKSKVMEQK